MSLICIIPARGGSKRIPRKNIKEFCGKPIIAYSIEAALKSGLFTEVMVSTDDVEIAAVARDYGAQVPFMRSATTADDYATTIDVLVEVIEEYKKNKQAFFGLCCIYPCAPFVSVEMLAAANALFMHNAAETVFPVVQYSYPVQRSVKISEGYLQMLQPENFRVRTQDLEPVYHDAGQFYFIREDILCKELVLFSRKALPLVVPETKVQDIDTEQDWVFAEFKYKYMNNIL